MVHTPSVWSGDALLLGDSAPMVRLREQAARLAPEAIPVLIQAESGTGKTPLAHGLHALSGRRGRLVVFDCAQRHSPEHIKSELFGHVKGAYSGAISDREGAFRRAHGGTLLLDEIGELPLESQVELLLAVEKHVVKPLGSDEPIQVDVRILAATHRVLADEVAKGAFRRDLFYRLDHGRLHIPPLRARASDIPMLVRHLIRKHRGRDVEVAPEVLESLCAYPFPGNVRELEGIVSRMLVASGHAPSIGREHLEPLEVPAQFQADLFEPGRPSPIAAGRRTLSAAAEQMFREAYARNGRNLAATSRELGVSVSTGKRRKKKYLGDGGGTRGG